jgi:hypothetical protein
MKVLFGIFFGMLGLIITCCAGLALLWVGFQLATTPAMWDSPLRLPEFFPQIQCAGWVWSLMVFGGFAVGIVMMRFGFAMFDRTIQRHPPKSISESRLQTPGSERREGSDHRLSSSSDRAKRESTEARLSASSDRMKRPGSSPMQAVPSSEQRQLEKRNKTTQNMK